MDSMSGILDTTFYGNTMFDWLKALAIIVAAVLIGRLAYWIFKNVAHKLTSKTETRLDDIIIDMIEEPIVVILTVIGVGLAFRSLSFEGREGIGDFLAFGELTVNVDIRAVTKHLEYGFAGQADNGIAAPFFTPLDRFKKERIRAFRQFAVGADGGFQVGQHFQADRYTVVVLCRHRGKVLRIHGCSSEIGSAFRSKRSPGYHRQQVISRIESKSMLLRIAVCTAISG